MTVEATQSIQVQALEFPSAGCSQPQTPPPTLTSNTQPHTLPSPFTSNTQPQTPPSRFTSNTQTQTPPPLLTSNTQAQTPPSPLTSNTQPQTPPSLLTSNTQTQTPPPLLTSNTQAQAPPSPLTGNTQPQTSRSPMARITHTSFQKCSKKVTSYAIASPSRKVLMRYAYRIVIDGNNTNVFIDTFFLCRQRISPKKATPTKTIVHPLRRRLRFTRKNAAGS